MEKNARTRQRRRTSRAARDSAHANPASAGSNLRGSSPELSGPRAMLVEISASFLFFFAFVMAAGRPGAGILTPMAVGAVYASVLAGLAPRGFCNPAVALAASLRGMLSVRLLLALWFAQAVAAVAAGRLAAWVFTSQEAPPLVPREGSAFWVEFIFGAGLCAVVLARSHRHPREAGLAGGLFLAGVGSAVAGISGAIFNPAAAWTMISSSLLDSGSFWIYGFAGVAAACASAAAALVVRPHNPGSQKSANLPHASKAKPPTREKTPHISQ